MEENIKNHFKTMNLNVLLVQFDKFNGFFSDKATIYLEIKNNPSCLKSMPRMISYNFLKNCIIHWEGAPLYAIIATTVVVNSRIYEWNALY